MIRTVQVSELPGRAVREVMDREFLFVTYHGKREVLMVPVPRTVEELDAFLILIRECFEQALPNR